VQRKDNTIKDKYFTFDEAQKLILPELGQHEKQIFYNEDRVFKMVIEKTLERPINNEQFHQIRKAAFEFVDSVCEGPPEDKEERRQEVKFARSYAAFLLRHDLDRVFYGHPYPSPTSSRMKRIWPVAKFLYSADDPNGFLGPSLAEIDYLINAILAAWHLGDREFDDIAQRIPHQIWYPYEQDCMEAEDFQEWLKTDDFFHMFENRQPHPDLDYSRMWSKDEKDWEYVNNFLAKHKEKYTMETELLDDDHPKLTDTILIP
jgi:hypothetical protein